MASKQGMARIGGLVLGATLVLAACSSSSTAGTAAPATSAPSSAPMATPPMTPESMAPASASATASMTPASGSPAASMAADAPFGTACSAVPATGAGSFSGMATDPVATAASHNPVLSTLVTAVGAAGLGDTLNTAQGITVFAPSNDAFAALPKATLDAAMKDPKGLLTTVLTYHVVAGRLSPDMLVGTHKTLQGGTIDIAGSGQSFTVNGTAKIICGNVQTANATVYIIDGVLLPKN